MKRTAGLGLCVLIVVLLGGCSWLKAPSVTCTLSCYDEYVDGRGTDGDWRVALDDESRRNSDSASGGSITFDEVEKGEHTLYFTPPAGCYDEVVASYTFTVEREDVELELDVFGDLDILVSVAPSFGSKMSEN